MGVTGEVARPVRVAATVAIGIGTAAFFLPLAWLLSTSLKRRQDVFAYPPRLLESVPQWSNYLEIWTQYPLARWVANTLLISVAIVVGQVLTSSLAGFTFAQLRFPGRDRLFFVYLAALLVPTQVLIIPIFVLVAQLGWVDTPWGLIIPALAGPFGTFLYRQHFLGISEDLRAAAEVDGASMWRIWWSIYLPLARGLTATFAAITFLASWNSYIWPLVLLRSQEQFTVTLGLASIAGAEQFRVPWELVMAASFTILTPTLLVFALAQRQLVDGVALSGQAGK